MNNPRLTHLNLNKNIIKLFSRNQRYSRYLQVSLSPFHFLTLRPQRYSSEKLPSHSFTHPARALKLSVTAHRSNSSPSVCLLTIYQRVSQRVEKRHHFYDDDQVVTDIDGPILS
jgi:hypothetical protein